MHGRRVYFKKLLGKWWPAIRCTLTNSKLGKAGCCKRKKSHPRQTGDGRWNWCLAFHCVPEYNASSLLEESINCACPLVRTPYLNIDWGSRLGWARAKAPSEILELVSRIWNSANTLGLTSNWTYQTKIASRQTNANRLLRVRTYQTFCKNIDSRIWMEFAASWEWKVSSCLESKTSDRLRRSGPRNNSIHPNYWLVKCLARQVHGPMQGKPQKIDASR